MTYGSVETHLCENVVDVTHFKDIVEDYILMCEKAPR